MGHELSVLRERIDKTDEDFIAYLAARTQIVTEIAEYKIKNNQPIVQREIENQRLERIMQLAREAGLDPEFARAVYYTIILGSSCMEIQIQESSK